MWVLRNRQNLGWCKKSMFQDGDTKNKGMAVKQAWLSLGVVCRPAEPEQKPCGGAEGSGLGINYGET